MKGAEQCTRRLRSLWRTLRARAGAAPRLTVGDPVTQLFLGIFTRDMPENRAREVLDRLRAQVVDFNELRVIPPLELAEFVGEYPDSRTKCEDLSRALNRIFAIEHSVTLDRLQNMAKKDVQAYLKKLDGLEEYTRARIRLLGLGHHAIPLDEAMWAYARKAGIVDPVCPLEDAQRFLETRIPEKEGLEFFTLFRRQAWAEMANVVRKGEVERILSVPPDRTARNMLQVLTPKAAPPPEPAAPAAARPSRRTTKSAASSPNASASRAAATETAKSSSKTRKSTPRSKGQRRQAKSA